MAIFSLRKPVKLIVRGASTSVIPNPQGIPMAVTTPGKTVELKSGVYNTNDQEIIDKIRKDVYFNTPEGIIEITEEDQEAISIKDKKMKEADAMIKEAKIKRQAK